ncbi:alpha-amylase family protein [Aureibaculum conchae]|uniref:hypothetical protein n=1 Tax=Aureibaculum sp. 2308TA14-22 TaxID=3108392 RepID=UPI00339A6EDB
MKRNTLLFLFVIFFLACKKKESIDFTIKNGVSEKFDGNQNPKLTLNSSKDSIVLLIDSLQRNFKGKTYIDILIKNISDSPLKIKGQLDNSFWNNGASLIAPKKENSLRLYFKGTRLPEDNPYKQLKGMNGLPNGHLWLWENLNETNIKSIKLQLLHNAKRGLFKITEIKSGGNIWQDTARFKKREFFPFVDRYGQYKHKIWKGKILNDNQLQDIDKEEQKALEAYQTNKDLDIYGGNKKGPMFFASGHFYTKKHENKWWLITPLGHQFWSQGLNCVRYTNTITQVQEREDYFEALPDSTDYFSKFYSQRNAYKTYNFAEANLYRKYGKDWQEISNNRMHQRLKAWGVNTIGNWSDPKVYQMQKTPYTTNIGYKWPERLGNLKMPNMCNPDFEKNLKAAFKDYKKTTEDPYCIGYFVDNELHGWESIAITCIAAKKDTYEKQAWIDFLKDEYIAIQELNNEWQSSFSTWEDIATVTDASLYPGSKKNVESFNFLMVHKYYKTVKKVLKEEAPNKLYLGSRLDFHSYPNVSVHQKQVVQIASKYCDVLSFNRYNYTVSEIKFDTTVNDLPIIIGEFHFGALDRGMPHTGLRSALNQKQRALLYYNYVASALENPQVVGTHWFQYQEHAFTGRGDGENYQIGFVDVCDTPYNEIINKSKIIGDKMYDIRNTKK